MRAAAYAPLLLVAGCASTTPAGVPPVIDIPAAPIATVPPTAPPVAAASASVAPPTLPPWTERVERSEKTHAVASCQISPFSFSSVMVVENRPVGAATVAVRVVQDDENAKGVQAPSSLLGRGYVIDRTDGTLHVHDTSGATVPDDASQRVLALGMAHLGWPGADVASHLPTVGTAVASLEAPVIALAAVPLHGDLSAQQAKATVRFAGTRKGDAGDELSFDVEITASEGDAGMCHRWENLATAKGELRLRARGGALLGLHLQGETHDTEALCQDPSGKPGPPPPPRTCNRGEVTVEVRQPHVPE